ncbi:MAG: hypothetical protein HY694_12540 [Deltaproteobacteria bacterium]|nr:hypothetical protein [Deltaproteobacteria bacterium]
MEHPLSLSAPFADPSSGNSDQPDRAPRRVFYRRVLAAAVPRVLGLMNRNPVSATWGCLDRNFWHYKTIIEFPCATYQQPVLAFAWLYCKGGQENRFKGNEAMREAARAAMLFWAKIQHRNGAFDEFYENEHSFCPTAFTTFAVSEALLTAEHLLAKEEREQLRLALSKAGDWLVAHHNPAVSNQMMAALNALTNIALLTEEQRYKEGAELKLSMLLESQHREGWFPEYGGADIGYSFKALDLLGHYFAKSEDERVAHALENLLDFVHPFVHPDGTVGGFYGSRNTAHFLPYGLELLKACGFGKAGSILQLFGTGAERELVLSPLSVDDKYLAYFYLNSYVGALLASEDQLAEAETRRPERLALRGAGLFSLCRGDWYLVGSGFKGGCFKLYYRDRLRHQEAGYFGEFDDGTKFSSQTYDVESKWEVQEQEGITVVEVESGFVRFDDSLPLVRYLLPFKLVTRMILKIGWLAQVFHRRLKEKKIVESEPVGLRLFRRIMMGEDSVAIVDVVRKETRKRVGVLRVCGDATVTHSASTRYLALGDLAAGNLGQGHDLPVKELNEKGVVVLERSVRINPVVSGPQFLSGGPDR